MRNRFSRSFEKCDRISGFGESFGEGKRESCGGAAANIGDNADAEPLGAVIEQLLDAYARRFPQLTIHIVETPAGCLP